MICRFCELHLFALMQARDICCVRRREEQQEFFSRKGGQEVVSVGLGVMPRGLRVAAARVRRATPARWRQRRDAWQRSPRHRLQDTLTPLQP